MSQVLGPEVESRNLAISFDFYQFKQFISGVHTYMDLHVAKMRDLCDRGEAWRTWHNLRIVDWSESAKSFERTGRAEIQRHFTSTPN